MTTKRIQEPKTLTLGEFVVSKIRDLDTQNATLGTITDGIWQESLKGEFWDTIRTGNMFECPKFIGIEVLVKEHKFYEEQFENRMMAIGIY